MGTIAEEIYGKDNIFMKGLIHMRQAQIYTEIKGEEYKAEDHLKKYSEYSEKVYKELESSQAESGLNYTYQVELMSGFLKLLRPEKVNKIAKEIYKALEEKGQQVSLAKMSVDLLSLQAEQDPLAVQSKI